MFAAPVTEIHVLPLLSMNSVFAYKPVLISLGLRCVLPHESVEMHSAQQMLFHGILIRLAFLIISDGRLITNVAFALIWVDHFVKLFCEFSRRLVHGLTIAEIHPVGRLLHRIGTDERRPV